MNLGKYLFIILFLIAMLPTSLFGQELLAMELEVNDRPEDTTKVNLLVKLGELHCANNNQKALLYLQEALYLSNNLNYKKGTAYSYLWLGRVYYYKDEYELGKTSLNKALVLFQGLNDMYGLAYTYFAFGSISDLMGDYISAMKEFQEVLKYGRLAKNDRFIAIGLYSIGAVHLDRHEFEEGFSYLDEALQIRYSIKDSSGIANTYNLKAGAYEKLHMYDSALYYYEQGLVLRKKMGSIRAIANSEYPMGMFFIRQKEYANAIEYLQNAQSHYINLDEQTGLCIVNTYLALALNYTDQKEKAQQLIAQAKEDATKFNNPTLLSDCYRVEAEMEAHNSNFAEAYKLEVLHKEINDRMAALNKEEIIQELEARYQLENKTNQIKLLKSQSDNQRKNIIILSISMGGLFLILVLITILFRLKSKDLKRQNQIFEQDKIIRTQDEKIKEKEMHILQESVESKNRELATKAIEMLRINETIGEVLTKLESLCTLNQENPKINSRIKEIVKELENQTNTNTWKEFDKIFKNIHTNFYNNLLGLCPALTASEIKIAALLKLNLSTKEIAAITYKSEDGIKSTRYRLRKKLNLGGEDKLIPYLMKL